MASQMRNASAERAEHTNGIRLICQNALLIWFALVLILPACGYSDEILTKIKIEDRSGVSRQAWPISGGIPLPKGRVTDVLKIGLHGTPCQTRVLSRWSDNSIKWVLLDYQADLAANETVEHTIIASDTLAQPTGNVVTEDDSRIVVDTGALKFSVSKTRFSFFDQAWLDLDGNGQYGASELVVAPDTGQRHFFDVQGNAPARTPFTYRARNLKTGASHSVANATPTIAGGPIWMRNQGGGSHTTFAAGADNYTARVRENGPLHTVIELKGRFPSTTANSWEGHTYAMLIHAYHGKSFVRVQHNFLFKGNPRAEFMRRLGLQLPLNFSQAPQFAAAGLASPQLMPEAGHAYLFNSGPQDVFHLYHQGFGLPWEVFDGWATTTGEDQTGGWIDVSTPTFGLTALFKDMAYMYPKQLSFDSAANTLTAWLWPDRGGLVLDMNATGWTEDDGRQGMQGVSFSHDIYLNFHGPSDEMDGNDLALAVNNPLQPYANPEWYSHRGTRAAGMIMPRDDTQFPKTEAYLATGTALIERSMSEFGWLGMLNYGDIMQDFSYNESGSVGTWGLSDRTDDYCGWRHGNTMLTYRMLMQYLRTGEYRYWSAADAHLRHVRDVLIKHYNAFRDQLPEEIQWTGMGRRHSAYWGAGPGIDQYGGVAGEGYGTNWLGHYLHWNLTGDWRTYDVIDEIRRAWHQFGNNEWVTELCATAFVGLKLIGGIPGYEQSVGDAEAYKPLAVSNARAVTDEWRDCTWFFGYGLYLQDYPPDAAITQALVEFGESNPGRDQYGLFWHRDALSAAYWAAEGNQPLRDSIYQNLLSNFTELPDNPPSGTLAERQWNLYDQFETSGLFGCSIDDLVSAVTNFSYWRIKDDMIQIQWDDPLSMAVIDHYRNGFPQNTAPSVLITTPANNATISEDDNPISFTATATDKEDGDISVGITWSSDSDDAMTPPTDLTVGTHTISASVTDSGGMTGSDSISVTITAGDGGTDGNGSGSGGSGGCFIDTMSASVLR